MLNVSRGTAVILLVCYVCYLAFQLYTHHELFCNEDDADEPNMSLGCAVIMLTIITAIVSVSSE